jgi:hypothetical protein
MIIVAVYNAAGIQFQMSVDQAWVSTYQPDAAGRFQAPDVSTASRVQGRLLWNHHEVSFDFLQAKAAPKTQKVIWLCDEDGDLVHEIRLNESGWYAHGRILNELIKPRPDMRHTLGDAIGVMDLIDASRAIATKESPYPFGHLPDFLIEEV